MGGRRVIERVQSVERGVDILLALATGPSTVTQLARDTGLSKGTAHRLLATLNREGFVLQDPADSRYMLGPAVLRLVQEAAQGLGAFAALGKPALVRLWELSGETVTLHLRIGPERMCVEEIPSPAPLRYVASVGSRAPLHVGAAGKVLLAFEEPEALERTLETLPLEAITPATIVNPHALRKELALVRRRGWASSTGERVPDAAAISVPVFSHGQLVAALSLLGPASRLRPKTQQELLPPLRSASVAFQAVLESVSPRQIGRAA
jgi:DNA-binding IclR family transcriptional regulator